MRGVFLLNLNNKYFIRGLLFILIGILFVFWSFNVIRINVFGILNFIFAIFLIFYGEKYTKFQETRSIGFLMMAVGVIIMINNFGLPIKFILAIVFFIAGIYFAFVKSKIFIVKKGVFKDSRDDVFIKEICSNIHINNISINLSSVKVKSYFSEINLDFSNSKMFSKNSVDFEINAFLSNVKINVSSNWNVMVNGEYIRKVEGSYKIANIKCSNFLSIIDIT